MIEKQKLLQEDAIRRKESRLKTLKSAIRRDLTAEILVACGLDTSQDDPSSTQGWVSLSGKVHAMPDGKGMTKLERLQCYESVAREIVASEQDKWEVDTVHRLREERKAREAYTEMLRTMMAPPPPTQGVLKPRMRWKEALPHLEHAETYLAVAANTSGMRPKELFEMEMGNVEKNLARQVDRLESELRSSDKSSEGFPGTVEELEHRCKGTPMLEELRRRGWVEFAVQMLVAREKKEVQRKRKRRTYFMKLLRQVGNVQSDSTWAEVRARVEGHSDFDVIPDDAERESLFERVRGHAKEDEEKRKDDQKPSRSHGVDDDDGGGGGGGGGEEMEDGEV